MTDRIETELVLGRRLQVGFVRQADRYQHLVQLVEGGGVRSLLTSVEGTPADTWPVSPPFQQLHIESRSGERCIALLVGMAGQSHWSMSAEPVCDQADDTSVAIEFDVACRAQPDKAMALGSSYRSEQPLHPLEHQNGLLLRVEPGWKLVVHPEVGSTIHLHGDDRRIRIAPGHQAGPTRRWKYRICLGPCDDRPELDLK